MKEKHFIKINDNFVLEPESGAVIPKTNVVSTIDYNNSFIGYDLFEQPKNPFDNNGFNNSGFDNQF